LEDVGKTIQEQIRNEMDEYKKKTEEQKLELIDIVKLQVKAIEDKGNVSLNQLNDALKLSVDTFDAKVQKAIQDIEVVAKKETENAIKEIQKAAVQRKTLINQAYVLTYKIHVQKVFILSRNFN
jgi:hypothetical protein